MLFRSDRKSTRLNSSHTLISYAVFCLKKKKPQVRATRAPLGRALRADRSARRAARDIPPARPPDMRSSERGGQPSHVAFFFLRIRRPPKSTHFPDRALFD